MRARGITRGASGCCLRGAIRKKFEPEETKNCGLRTGCHSFTVYDGGAWDCPGGVCNCGGLERQSSILAATSIKPK